MATSPRVCNDFTASGLDGTMTLAGTAIGLTVSGSLTFQATNFTRTYTGTTTFNATTTGKTITTNGVIFGTSVVFNGVGGGWTLGSALTASSPITLTNGTFDTSSSGNYAVTCSQVFSSNGNVRTINLNASTITCNLNGNAISLATITNLTFNAGTSQINLSGSSSAISSGGLTFYNVSFTNTTSTTISITGANTFNNFAITAPASAGVTNVTFNNNQTINGTLSTTGTAGNRRVFFASDTYGIGRTLTVNSAPSLTDADFRDLYVRGTAAPISGTRIGNRGNNSGITFSTPKTVYWNLAAGGSWSDNAWATSSGGAVSTDNFPLPQDTAIIGNTGLNTSGSITLVSAIGYISSIDMSTRTNAMNLTFGASQTSYGNFKNGSGTTIAGTSLLTFSGGTTQTITSAGKTFSCPITVDTYGGTVQLADALNIGTNNLTVTNGTFTTAGFAVGAGSLTSTNSNVRTINFGASTVTLRLSTFISMTTITNLTFNAGTSSIISNFNGDTSIASGGLTFYNVTISSTFSGTYSITGANTFNNLTFTSTSSAGIQTVSINSNQTINGTLTCAGASAVRRIFLQSQAIGTQRTLTAAAISANDCDFRDIVLAGAAAGSSPTRAGDCGNNSGITFPAPKTVYWNLAGAQNWSATGWCTGSGGTPDINQFPLAQDTAVFDNTGSAGTVTVDAAWNIGTFDASLRTSAMALTATSSFFVYGDWKFGTGVTSNSTANVPTFSKNGIQTITSNGIQFNCPITINNPNAYVQLADALSLGATRTLTLTTGTFDAVTYNVTTGLFSGSAGTMLRMGSGTWTLSGTGTVWDQSDSAIQFAGTSTIVLSDTSTTARTFTGGGFYYNKLTIGGTTGTSTLSFPQGNTYGELASTKTVAHTILFGSTLTHNIGKWSVTGTAGNVVTVGPTTAASAYFIVIYGPANTGIDYLSVSYCTIGIGSPGEWYVGANSINTAGNTNAIFFTATPTPRTLYWVGGTGNWSSTTKWATSSGGVSGAAIPTSLDTVTFDSMSNPTAYTATIDAGVTIARCAAFTMAGPLTGNVTWDGTVQIAFHGNVSFAATGITRTYTGNMNWAGNSSYTFTTNGLTLGSACTVNGIGSTWTLGSALTSSLATLTVTYGTFGTSGSNYSVSAANFNSNNTNVRSVLFNASTLALTGTSFINFSSPNLLFNCGTSTISTNSILPTFSGGTQTFYNVSFTSNSALSISITGANTFNNLTFTGPIPDPAVTAVNFSANQTINGTLTLNAGTEAAYRTFLRSDTIGTPRTLTVNALAAGAADIDFRDITVTGAAAPLTGTRFGDCKGNSGITFPTAKTVYWRQTGSVPWGQGGVGSWSATSGGAFDATQFPLAQDTAVFPAATYPASGQTTTINAAYNIGTIDMSLRTSNTMTLATSTSTPQIYGNWINGTGTTLSGTGTMTFAGRGSQTITSAGKSFTQQIVVNSPSGSVTLQDSFVCSSTTAYAFVLSAGTLDANGYNVTQTGSATFGLISSSSGVRTIAIGSGTWLTAATTAWNVSGSTLTITGTGTISLTSASTKTFAGGGISYSGITLNQGGAGALTITGNNTFANITNTSGVATSISLAATTQTVGAFTAAGTAGNLLTITGTSAASPATLIYTGSGSIAGLDYLAPTFVRAYSPTATWYAGNNSTNGGTLGWIFSYLSPVSYTVNGQFFAFF
jgi:hypothetical protein